MFVVHFILWLHHHNGKNRSYKGLWRIFCKCNIYIYEDCISINWKKHDIKEFKTGAPKRKRLSLSYRYITGRRTHKRTDTYNQIFKRTILLIWILISNNSIYYNFLNEQLRRNKTRRGRRVSIYHVGLWRLYAHLPQILPLHNDDDAFPPNWV